MPGGLFGSAKKTSAGDEEIGRSIPNSKGKGREEEAKGKKRRVMPGPRGLIPAKDDLFRDPLPNGISAPKPAKNSRKRPSSRISDGEAEAVTASNAWGLLPPSPPRTDGPSARYQPKVKSKTGQIRQAKKMKISERTEDDATTDGESTSSEGVPVEIVSWKGKLESPKRGDNDNSDIVLELEPELQLQLPKSSQKARALTEEAEEFIVDLPEEMQRILALSPHDADRETEEADLVKGLMRGQPRGGVEVWGPGEFTGESDGSENMIEEDDWEGEGVPWEVGEL